MQEETQLDFQNLVNHCHSMAEKFLIEFQEFYPFGAYINLSGELISVGFHDGDEFPLSQTIIDNLSHDFKERLYSKIEIRAYAITYDAKVRNADFPDSIDTITMKIVNKENNLVYYFPYKIINTQLEFYESWAELQS